MWRITESYYEEKRKEYRAKQREINGKVAKLHFSDEEYYIASEYLLKLASNASELFVSSEPQEKRLLLKMTLQNLNLKGRKLHYDWIKPFDKIASYASRQEWLPSPSDNILPDFSTFLKVLEDFNYMGMLKGRWEEIKHLQSPGVTAKVCF